MDTTRLDDILHNQLERTLVGTDLPDLGKRSLGKVRDSYVDGGSRALVVTDRLSTFDVVVGTVRSKARYSTRSPSTGSKRPLTSHPTM